MEEIQGSSEEYPVKNITMKRNRTLMRENTRAVEEFFQIRKRRKRRRTQKNLVNRERLKIEGRGEINDIAIANMEDILPLGIFESPERSHELQTTQIFL